MLFLRLRIGLADQTEWIELPRSAVVFGRSGSTIDVFAAGVRAPHARLEIRRGRLVLLDLGPRRDRIAPRVLAPGEPFALGDATVEAWVGEEPLWSGRTIEGRRVLRERPTAGGDHRRFTLEGDAELLLCDGAGDWPALAAQAGFPPLHATGTLLGHRYGIEAVEPGMRLSSLLSARAFRSTIELPDQVALSVIGQLVEQLIPLWRSFGPHGAIDGRSVQLGTSGNVTLLRPGPAPDGYGDPASEPLLTAARRHGARPEIADDRFALAVLAQQLLPEISVLQTMLVLTLMHGPAEGIPECVREVARLSELDPARGHVARVVRVLFGRRPFLAIRS